MNCPKCNYHIYYLQTIVNKDKTISCIFACSSCREFFEENIYKIHTELNFKSYIGRCFLGKEISYITLPYTYYNGNGFKIGDYNEYPILIQVENGAIEYTRQIKDLYKKELISNG